MQKYSVIQTKDGALDVLVAYPDEQGIENYDDLLRWENQYQYVVFVADKKEAEMRAK